MLSHNVLYLRFSVDGKCDPVGIFLDILELDSLNAESILTSILKCLASHGLTDDILSEYWLGFGSDGASVMVGSKSGVFTRLKEKYPRIISWHCFNHRLELSVHDAVKTCTEVNHFKEFMEKLHTIYSTSPKARRALAECAADLSIQIDKIGLNHRTLRRVWTLCVAACARS